MNAPLPAPVALADLLDVLPRGARLVGAPADGTAVVDVTHDSRQAGPGVLLACRPGGRVDGHDFAPAAVAAGTPALLVQRPLDLPVPQLLTPDVGAVLAAVAARVHGDPSRSLALLGVTGTSGKTTTTFLLDAALRAAGHVTGLIGTVRTVVAGEAVDAVRTTPEATDLQRLLHRMVDAGVTAAAMEVSSHGLALGRVAGTRFAAAGFTNLSQDHLDFHRDMADYEAAKTRLFDPAFTGVAAVTVDDDAGRRIAATAERRGLRVLRVSGAGGTDGGPADVTARDVVLGPAGSAFTAVLDGRAVPVRVRLPGAFNVANTLLALALAAAAGVDPVTAARDAGQPFAVVVDYAHKPAALEGVLRAARDLVGSPGGRVAVVIGAGGDRDQGKRAAMGRAAGELADLVVLTSDNPRSEDPRAILDALLAGVRSAPGATATATVQPDRRAAIATALAQARPGDVVVIAGKGHETYQEIGDVTVPFDDRAVARELLAAHEGAPA
jgi:UDP-N-acetylmuramoyl-L-alanyl-D-glutamate--2,6-diaminopimelate ligase